MTVGRLFNNNNLESFCRFINLIWWYVNLSFNVSRTNWKSKIFVVKQSQKSAWVSFINRTLFSESMYNGKIEHILFLISTQIIVNFESWCWRSLIQEK